jgi:hypothetical protein
MSKWPWQWLGVALVASVYLIACWPPIPGLKAWAIENAAGRRMNQLSGGVCFD